jgi:hypothetical protein
MARERVPERGYDYDDANVYDPTRDVILIANVHADCRSTVRTSEIEGSSQSIGVPESGSANVGGHAHGCGRGSWQMLAEHRMKPFYAEPQIQSSFGARATTSSPRICIVTVVYL